MSTAELNHHHEHHDSTDKDLFGFWVYIMSDCILFATLFATYAVLMNKTYGGPGPGEVASLPYIFVGTMLLLTSSFSFGIALLARQAKHVPKVLGWLTVTFILGLGFICMEIYEFSHLAHVGEGWTRSAYLSAFFTLVGTHGLHVALGLGWMILLMIQIAYRGITPMTNKKLLCLGLFWHFLDVIWIFVFTIVYLYGAV